MWSKFHLHSTPKENIQMLTPNHISSEGMGQQGEITVHSANSPSPSGKIITPPSSQSWHPNPNATPFPKSTPSSPERKYKPSRFNFMRRGPQHNLNHPRNSFRSSGALHAERSYLLSSLEHENLKAVALLRQISPLEEQLAQAHRGARKIKKQIGWLRSRLEEASRQEETILAWLGQLTHEIQIRERWGQIENERREWQCRMIMGVFQGIGGLQLNAATPEFQPQAPCLPWSPMHWSAHQQQFSYGRLNWPRIAPAPEFDWQEIPPTPFPLKNSGSQDCSEDVAEGDTKGANAELLRPLLHHRPASCNDAKLTVLETSTKYLYPPASMLSLKRHSLPSLPGCQIWALTPKEQGLEKT
jgi:hypothetical protein